MTDRYLKTWLKSFFWYLIFFILRSEIFWANVLLGSSSKIYNFVTTGTARPKAKSEQDGVNEEVVQFKVRYQYAPLKDTFDKDGKKIDFVKKLKKIGNVIILKPTYVNFMNYTSPKNKEGINRFYKTKDKKIDFKIEDLQFENYSKWFIC